ncbi:hypothetical protein [Corynebacterium halotolerans]|uniref:DUF4190 domain-containing protein n=1 Tax=Corynebacterium halotolerans YIM 70093 = DSM 44683 TaxID=1121362 RepID=M1MY47_9CORY|nr:hypothetical protein [Corynebacterium halotolerans]AGF72654.1 hypothetical protein A605_08260 [Corynebacterium halotolerans YIM 70093 = DSM 44683]
MTNPSDPRDPGPGPGSGPTDYGAYQYPVGGSGPQPGNGYQGGHQDGFSSHQAYPGASSGSHEQFNYGGAGTWAINEEKNSVAPWALGVSILAVVVGLTIIGAPLAFIPGLIGLVLGIIGVVRARRIRGPRRRMGMSVTAIVLSVIAVLMTVALVVLAFFVAGSGAMDCFMLSTPEEQQACLDEWARSTN